MPNVATIPGTIAAQPAGLEDWMTRVIDRAAKARRGFDIDDVHDLRVALRRCRTMADALSDVNPNPGWRKLKKASGPLFHALGELRDVQVMSAHTKKMAAASDPVRRHMLRQFAKEEKQCRDRAADALDAFDRKEWKRLAHRIGPKARFFPLESVVFQRLALSQLNQAAALYQQARRKRSDAAWHKLRIAIKRFRYTVENFLPQRHALWSSDLKRMQTILGEVHDIVLLRAAIRRHARRMDPVALAAWNKKFDAERKSLLAEVNAKLSGPQSLWNTWRAGFSVRHPLAFAPTAQAERRSA